MQQAFVHEAHLIVPAGGDERGPGGAITLALCGAWEHPPPCPLAPHHTSVRSDPDGVRLRTLFVVPPDREQQVRELIDRALALEGQVGPDGVVTSWSVLDSRPAALQPDELELARHLGSGSPDAGSG